MIAVAINMHRMNKIAILNSLACKKCECKKCAIFATVHGVLMPLPKICFWKNKTNQMDWCALSQRIVLHLR